MCLPNYRIPIIAQYLANRLIKWFINSGPFISLAHSMFYFCTHENYTSNYNTCTIRTIHNIFTAIFQVDESTGCSANPYYA